MRESVFNKIGNLGVKYPLLVVGLFYFLVCVYVTEFIPNLSRYYLSPKTPIGIFTSLFVYDGWTNIVVFMGVGIFYYISNLYVPEENQMKRTWSITLAIFSAAILANYLWLFTDPSKPSIGQSGVVYALIGVMMIFALHNVFTLNKDSLKYIWKSLKTRHKAHLNKLELSAVMSIPVFAIFFYQIVSSPSVFLSKGTNINYFVHGVSFLLAFYVFAPLILYVERFGEKKGNRVRPS